MKSSIFLTFILAFFSVGAFAAEVQLPKALLDRHVQACPKFQGEQGSYLTSEVFELPMRSDSSAPAPNKLFVLGCEMYAYNSMAKAYIVDSYGEITDVAVTEVEADGNFTATTSLMGAGYDSAGQELGTFVKGRGIGDCGMTATYKYNIESGRFVLVEQRLKMECDGSDSDWPVVFPKK